MTAPGVWFGALLLAGELLASSPSLAVMAASESGADSFAAAGAPVQAGSIAASEGGVDGFALSGGPLIAGALAGAESGEDGAAIGRLIAYGALAASDAADSAEAAGGTSYTGALAAQDAGDSFAFAGGPLVGAALTASEAGDTSSMTGHPVWWGVTEGWLDTGEAGDSASLIWYIPGQLLAEAIEISPAAVADLGIAE